MEGALSIRNRTSRTIADKPANDDVALTAAPGGAASDRHWRRPLLEGDKSGEAQPVGPAVAYKLVPGTNALPFLHPQSPSGRRAAFMFRHFWATHYAPDELYPAGWYPNQHAGGDGLPRWTAADRSLDNENLVVWYTLNYHHLPRLEDWPVQPMAHAGFHWMPSGFFDANPALDVPAPMANGHRPS
jgi:Cu2+-containing amine oxidase